MLPSCMPNECQDPNTQPRQPNYPRTQSWDTLAHPQLPLMIRRAELSKSDWLLNRTLQVRVHAYVRVSTLVAPSINRVLASI